MDDRALRARELRESGMKWSAIADRLDFATASGAYHAAKRAGLVGTRPYESKHVGETDEQRRERVRGYRRKHQPRRRLKKYGLTPEEHAEMYAAQDGLCGICGTGERPLVIDHDHVTGAVRGLLCNRCNSGLGFFEDNLGLIGQATAYLAFGVEVSMSTIREGNYEGNQRTA